MHIPNNPNFQKPNARLIWNFQRSVRGSCLNPKKLADQIARAHELYWIKFQLGSTTCHLLAIQLRTSPIQSKPKFNHNHTRGRHRTNSFSCKVTDTWASRKPLIIDRKYVFLNAYRLDRFPSR